MDKKRKINFKNWEEALENDLKKLKKRETELKKEWRKELRKEIYQRSKEIKRNWIFKESVSKDEQIAILLGYQEAIKDILDLIK
jgi:hypothetical protein